jgi:hypothetical protein
MRQITTYQQGPPHNIRPVHFISYPSLLTVYVQTQRKYNNCFPHNHFCPKDEKILFINRIHFIIHFKIVVLSYINSFGIHLPILKALITETNKEFKFEKLLPTTPIYLFLAFLFIHLVTPKNVPIAKRRETAPTAPTTANFLPALLPPLPPSSAIDSLIFLNIV